MQHQLIRHGQGSRTWSIVLDAGEEVAGCLQAFARAEVLNPTHFTVTGSLQDAVLGHLAPGEHDFRRDPLDHRLQIISLAGDVDLHDSQPRLRMRAVLGDSNGATFDGYLLEGHADAGLEVIMTEAPVQLHKDYDTDAGLALFKHKENS
jgi:hypothetical protein